MNILVPFSELLYWLDSLPFPNRMQAEFDTSESYQLLISDIYISEYQLFPDTEILKYVPEDFVGGDFARDFAKVVKSFADVLGQQIGGEGGGESL